jgi:MFS family permease
VLFTAYGAQYSFGVFFNALLQEFHWSRASLSGVFSLYAFGYSVFGFPAGRLTDAWGPTRVIAGGALFLGAALASMALVTELWQPYLLYGVIAAVGMGTAYVPCNSTVVKWFARRRGLAVGLASSGGSVGTFVVPPVAQLAVSALGWRGAYLVVGATVFAVLAATAPLMRRDPESMGLHPDGDATSPPVPRAGGEGLTLTAAARTSTFRLMAIAFAATWIPVFIPLVHVVPLARDLGHSPMTAAAAVSVLGGGAVVGRLVMGIVSDRIGRRPTIGLGMLLQATGFAAFTVAHELLSLYAAALVFGFSYGDDLDPLSGDRGRLLRARARRRDRGMPVRAGRLHGRLGPAHGRRCLRRHRQLPGGVPDLGRPEPPRRRAAGRVPAASTRVRRGGGMSGRAILRRTITAAGERR